MALREACKKYIMLGFLATGRVQVYFDPRVAGVVVPETFKADTHLRLDYGDALGMDPESVQVTDEGIRCVLSFQHEVVETYVPWSAVFSLAASTGGVVMWESALPQELRAAAPEPVAAVAGAAATSAPRPRPDWLRLV